MMMTIFTLQQYIVEKVAEYFTQLRLKFFQNFRGQS